MWSIKLAAVLALPAQVLGHGYIYKVATEDTVYPGWDVNIDRTLSPAPKRIAYGGGGVDAILDVAHVDIACNRWRYPVPSDIAEVRAGSSVTFYWSSWLYSHRGPVTAWMAPYEGDVASVNVSQLEFVKFAEQTMDPASRVWGTDLMMNKTNLTFTATIPADIKPGKYIVRQEIIALHFALRTPPGFEIFPTGPQFYMTCFNFNVTGGGNATPKGTTFPGAYALSDPGFHFDIYDTNSTASYPSVGPAAYKSTIPGSEAGGPAKERVVISPTGQGAEADTRYYRQQNAAIQRQVAMDAWFDSMGG